MHPLGKAGFLVLHLGLLAPNRVQGEKLPVLQIPFLLAARQLHQRTTKVATQSALACSTSVALNSHLGFH